MDCMRMSIQHSCYGMHYLISTTTIYSITQVDTTPTNRSDLPFSTTMHGILMGARAHEMVESR